MILLLLACTSSPDTPDEPVPSDSSPDSQTEETGWPDDTGPQDTGPWDVDGDGANRGEDCDDHDPAVFPGAEEVFDGEDNDCDGVVDAVGEYRGSVRLSARAWYEGQPHDFQLDCPTTMSRSLLEAPFSVSCSVEASDSWGQLLLGETLTLTPEDPYLWELQRWEGDVVVSSSLGWDTRGSGSMSWSSMQQARLQVSLSAQYLGISAGGELYRD